jgi:hypothetical protein
MYDFYGQSPQHRIVVFIVRHCIGNFQEMGSLSNIKKHVSTHICLSTRKVFSGTRLNSSLKACLHSSFLWQLKVNPSASNMNYYSGQSFKRKKMSDKFLSDNAGINFFVSWLLKATTSHFSKLILYRYYSNSPYDVYPNDFSLKSL